MQMLQEHKNCVHETTDFLRLLAPSCHSFLGALACLQPPLPAHKNIHVYLIEGKCAKV